MPEAQRFPRRLPLASSVNREITRCKQRASLGQYPLQPLEERERVVEPSVSLITLGVKNLEPSVAFYQDGLGWPLSGASVEGEVAFFRTSGTVLASGRGRHSPKMRASIRRGADSPASPWHTTCSRRRRWTLCSKRPSQQEVWSSGKRGTSSSDAMGTLRTLRGTCGRWLGILPFAWLRTAHLGYLINIFGSPLSENLLSSRQLGE